MAGHTCPVVKDRVRVPTGSVQAIRRHVLTGWCSGVPRSLPRSLEIVLFHTKREEFTRVPSANDCCAHTG